MSAFSVDYCVNCCQGASFSWEDCNPPCNRCVVEYWNVYPKISIFQSRHSRSQWKNTFLSCLISNVFSCHRWLLEFDVNACSRGLMVDCKPNNVSRTHEKIKPETVIFVQSSFIMLTYNTVFHVSTRSVAVTVTLPSRNHASSWRSREVNILINKRQRKTNMVFFQYSYCLLPL